MQTPTRNEIAQLAHELWMERGCPDGSPEVDWQNAEQILSSPLKRSMAMRISTAVGLDGADGHAHNGMSTDK